MTVCGSGRAVLGNHVAHISGTFEEGFVEGYGIDMNNLTIDKLKEYIRYEPHTGKFFLLKKRTNSDVVGSELQGFHNKWGYGRITLFGIRYYSHRLAWFYVYGEFSDKFIDHINGDRKDNRIDNLRECTNSENQANTRSIKSMSGYKGVYPVRKKDGSISSWVAQWNKIHIGCFKTKELAAEAYDNVLKQNRGDFAATNKEILSL